jgi:hypothetical protein
MSRKLVVPTLLAASVAGPYAATNAPQWAQQWRGAPAAAPAQEGHTTNAAPGAPATDPAKINPALAAQPQGPGANLFPTQTPLEGVPTYSIGDVLRFDVSKEWVYQRWARKSTALSELDLFGVRVPLVTGTQLHDLAGSLTYFFGVDGRVRRISFRGRTGDTTQLVAIVAQRFGLQPQATLVAGEQVLQVRRGEEVISQLRSRPAAVLWSSAPHDSFAVELDLQDPATAQPLKTAPATVATASAPAPQTALPAAHGGPAAQTAQPQGGAQANSPVAAPAEKPQEPTWKAFFPRSRIPKGQVNNLNRGNLYQ